VLLLLLLQMLETNPAGLASRSNGCGDGGGRGHDAGPCDGAHERAR
jgi:hypothetical protein